MPRAVYILCSESGAVDRYTGLVSHFHVYETAQVIEEERPVVTEGPSERRGQPMEVLTTIRVTAVWMRNEDDDPHQEYEHRLVIYLPGDEDGDVVGEGTFVFSRPLHRFAATLHAKPFSRSGIFRVESRVRKIGAAEWLSQDYPIVVEVIQSEARVGPKA